MVGSIAYLKPHYYLTVKTVRKDEKKYYNDLVDYSLKNLMLFPYHLSDVIIKGIALTPFQFYVSMLDTLMAQEKSYDSLPNFTAADCKFAYKTF